MSQSVRRLLEQFQPQSYRLWLELDDDQLTFKGQVLINGRKAGRPSKRITLHQKELTILAAKIRSVSKTEAKEIPISRINKQASFDELRLHSDQLLYPGDYQLEIDFKGDITRPMNGIYPCFFKDNRQDKRIIATQFESHHAREAFPCIDEPAAKARFDLTLVTKPSIEVISNTPVKDQKTKDGRLVTSFETTPVMSTYLLAFVAGEMGFVETKTSDNTLVRVYATKANTKYLDFALANAKHYLEFYNDYYAIKYPLAKCDLVALPDFAVGGMENWGLMTFREQALVVDEANTSLSAKQFVANVIAHEVTHQWFGDLVTMSWWNDLWLNESFASWMSYLAVDDMFPDWQVWRQFIVDEQGLALKLDSLEHTHPVEAKINHPDEIRSIFDAISYEKGASVLHMLAAYLGFNDFRDGLRLYLKRHAYANAVTTDLWTALEEVSNKPVRQFMAAWTSQSGYPIIRSTLDKSQLTLKQERFYINPQSKQESAIWPIPLHAAKDLAAESLNDPTATFPVTQDLILLNRERTGFYRVIYDQGQQQALRKAIAKSQLDELDLMGILNDEVEAAKAGHDSIVDALKLTAALKNDSSLIVWEVIASTISSIRLVISDDQVKPDLKRYVKELVQPQLKRLGWEDKKTDSHFDKLLRPLILGLASYGEDPSVVKEALARFKSASKSADIKPDLRAVVYGTAARLGDQPEFNKLLKLYRQSSNSEDRLTMAAALTGFKQTKIINQALKLFISDDVRLQDFLYWLAYSMTNHHSRDLTWQWLKDNWQWVSDHLSSDIGFSRLPLYVGRTYSDTSFIKELQSFFEPKLGPGLRRPLNQAIETITYQAAWKERDYEAVQNFLARS